MVVVDVEIDDDDDYFDELMKRKQLDQVNVVLYQRIETISFAFTRHNKPRLRSGI